MTFSRATSQAVKDSVAGMAAMKESILPKKKKHKKSKRSKTGGDSDSDSLDGITKVHQDNEYSKISSCRPALDVKHAVHFLLLV